jgi:uncharacterized DUF497 family protein
VPGDSFAIRFEWDENKNRSNQIKHGLSFEEAIQVFRDPLHLTVSDRLIDGEQRWHTFGLSGGLLLLMISHTIREEDAEGSYVEVIRVISARRATPRERNLYEASHG